MRSHRFYTGPMASDTPTSRTISADVGDADAAVEALRAAGVPRNAITLGQPVLYRSLP